MKLYSVVKPIAFAICGVAVLFISTLVAKAENIIDLRLVTETSYTKLINGDSGMEFLIKTSIDLQPGITLKAGYSENFTGYRSSPFSLNHGGTKFNLGVYWDIFNDLQIGYIHSEAKWFDGAAPTTVYMNDSSDTFAVRKEFDFKL